MTGARQAQRTVHEVSSTPFQRSATLLDAICFSCADHRAGTRTFASSTSVVCCLSYPLLHSDSRQPGVPEW